MHGVHIYQYNHRKLSFILSPFHPIENTQQSATFQWVTQKFLYFIVKKNSVNNNKTETFRLASFTLSYVANCYLNS